MVYRKLFLSDKFQLSYSLKSLKVLIIIRKKIFRTDRREVPQIILALGPPIVLVRPRGYELEKNIKICSAH